MSTENKKNILLVEDQVILSMAEKLALEQYGYSVITAMTGEQAIDTVKSVPAIDLILMDIDLGNGIDGTEAAEIILRNHNIPIVFLSSHTEPKIVEKTEKITSYGYVVKNSGITILDASIKMAFKLFDANKKIVEAEMKQKSMIDNISDVISIIDESGIIKYVSPNIEKLFGWQPQELLGLNGWDRVHPDELKKIQEISLQIFKNENTVQPFEFNYECKDGSYKPIELTATNLLHNPIINGILLNYHDISERKLMEDELKNNEQALKKQNNLFVSLLKNLPIGVFMVEAPSGKPLLANEAAFELLGRGILPDASRQNLAEVYKAYKQKDNTPYPPDEMPILQGMNGKSTHIDDMVVIRPDGTKTLLEIFGSPVSDDMGNIWASLVSFFDITERKKIEENLQNKSEEFESLNEELTAALEEFEAANEELIRANEDLLEKEKELTEEKVFTEALLESIPGILYVYDEKGRLIRWNKKHEQITGYTAEEMACMTSPDWHPEDENPKVAAAVEKVLATGYGEVEAHLLLKNGKKILMNFNGVRLNFDGKTYFTGVGIDITKQKQIETALIEKEVQYRNLADSGLALIWTSGTDKLCNYFNAPWLNFTGRTLEQEMGNGWTEGVHPDDFNHCLNIYVTAFDKREKFDMEYRLRNAKGEYRWLRDMGTPNYNNKGEFTGYIGHCFDITEQKTIENDLKKSRERLKQALNAANAGTWEWDIQTNINTWSDELWPLYGLVPNCCEPSYDLWIQSVLPIDRESIVAHLNEALAHKSELNIEWRVNLPNGKERWVMSRGKPEFDSTGQLIRYLGIVLDITERKLIEKALKETNEYLENLFNYANAPIIVWDPQFKIIRFNRAFETITGRTTSEVLGKSIDILFPSSQVEDSMKLIQKTLTGERWEVIEINIQHSDGSIRTVIWNSATLFSSDGKLPIATIAQGQDITARVAAESKVKSLLDEKELLLKEVHHRIKNHMNTISYLLLLQAGNAKDASAAEALQDAGSRVQSMMVLYNKLYQSADFHEISVQQYLPSLIDEIMVNFSEKKPIEIEKDIDDFILDVQRIQPLGIIVNELLTNTFKYAFTDKPEGLIIVSAKLIGRRIVLSIQDNGKGMPEAIDFTNSTGFGLMLVSMLTKQLKGAIRIERGNGTKFILEFDL